MVAVPSKFEAMLMKSQTPQSPDVVAFPMTGQQGHTNVGAVHMTGPRPRTHFDDISEDDWEESPRPRLSVPIVSVPAELVSQEDLFRRVQELEAKLEAVTRHISEAPVAEVVPHINRWRGPIFLKWFGRIRKSPGSHR